MSKANRAQQKSIAGIPISMAAVTAKVQGSRGGTPKVKGTIVSTPSVTFVSARPAAPSSLIGLLADLTDSADLSEEAIEYRHPRHG